MPRDRGNPQHTQFKPPKVGTPTYLKKDLAEGRNPKPEYTMPVDQSRKARSPLGFARPFRKRKGSNHQKIVLVLFIFGGLLSLNNLRLGVSTYTRREAEGRAIAPETVDGPSKVKTKEHIKETNQTKKNPVALTSTKKVAPNTTNSSTTSVATLTSSLNNTVGSNVIIKRKKKQTERTKEVILNTTNFRRTSAVALASSMNSIAESSLKVESRKEQPERLKFFAIHIGPSKTGTSKIQDDLCRNPFAENTLEKDRVIYVGKNGIIDENGKESFRSSSLQVIRMINGTRFTPHEERVAYFQITKCMIEQMDDKNHPLDINEQTKTSLRELFHRECWDTYKDGKYRYMLDYNMIDSDEAYSYTKSGPDHAGKLIRIFDILGFDKLVVVGAYRRYAPWLVSSLHQSMKRTIILPNLNGQKQMYISKIIKQFLITHIGHQRDTLKYTCKAYSNLDQSFSRILKMNPSSSKPDVKILNFFQQPKNITTTDESTDFKTFDSITTELYCDALGMELVPHTCSHALSNSGKASSSSSSSTVNKGSISNAIYQQIVAAGFQRGFLLPTDKELQDREVEKQCNTRKNKKKKEMWCEIFWGCMTRETCKILESQMLEQKWYQAIDQNNRSNNITVVGTNSSIVPRMFKDLSHYHNKVHNSTWTESLPLKCTPKAMLERLLQKSLAFERLVMPEFYATPYGKAEHERLFWDVWHGEKKLFCWVDLVRLFANATSWDEIINDRMVNYHWPQL